MLRNVYCSDAPVEIGGESIQHIADDLAALQRFVYKRFGGDPAYQEAGVTPPEDPSQVMLLEKIESLNKRLSNLTSQLEETRHHLSSIEKMQEKVSEKMADLQRQFLETNETVKKAENQAYTDRINKMTADELVAHIETSGRLLAEELFEKALHLFIKKFEKDPRIVSVYKELVYLTYKKESYKETAFYAGEFYKRAPQSDESPEILIMMAFALSKIEKTSEACTILSKLERDYPKTSEEFKERLSNARNTFSCPT